MISLSNMFLFRIISVSLIVLPVFLMGQERVDSVMEISGVEVRASHLFQKERAGMKQSGVDSLVFAGKVSMSLSDVLSESTPVFIKSHGRGALATASFRGTASSHTRVNWNGISISSPMAGMVDFSLIPVYVIDEISLRHGTASIADGSGGLGGSINISNRANWDNTLQAGYTQGLGSYATYDEFLQLGAGSKRLQIRSRLYHNQSANNYSFLNRGIGMVEDGRIVHPTDTNRNAGYKRYGFLQEFYYQPYKRHVVSVKWWSQWADRSIPQGTSYEGPEYSNLNRQADTDHRLVVDWNRYAERGKWEVRSGYSHKQLNYTLHNDVAGLGLVPAIYSDSWQNSFFNHAGWSIQVNDRLSLQSGLDINIHQVASRDSVAKTGYERSQSEYSLLATGQYSVWQRLNLNVMVRQEMIQGRISPLLPFAGFDLLLLNDPGLVFKGHVARNYHHPTLNDMYWQPGGNPDLLPEEGISMEAGLQYQAMLRQTQFEAEVTAYRTDVNNWILWIPSLKGYWQPNNISRVLSRGLEVSTRADSRIGRVGVKAVATYAYTRSINYGDPLVWGDASYGKQLVYIPVHSGNVFLHLRYKGFYMGWQHNSYSERFTTSGNDISRRNWLYPYFMNDLSFGTNFQSGRLQLAAELKVYNLFDETYHSILYRPMPGRHVMVMVKIGMERMKSGG